ncbi:MAG: radical SAM protein [Chloroflexota bacterium]|nr:radical SAM protein [Chloroflexota bacterium]
MPDNYIFRYKLDLESEGRQVYHHRPAELVRHILESLLGIIVPLKAGSDVNIDGFRWLMDKQRNYEIFPGLSLTSSISQEQNKSDPTERKQSISLKANAKQSSYQNARNVAFYEPRIDLIKNLLESLLPLVELERDGQVIDIDGFRLRNLQDWLVPSSGDPGEVFDYAGSHCNCSCVFCCNRGNISSVATADNLNRAAEEEFEEMKTRIKHFSPQARSALFAGLDTVYEVTAHPYFLEVMRLLRVKTSQPFRITTNGSNLTPEVVAELVKLKPIYLYLSLNSSSPQRRQKLMKDSKPEIAINALPLLRQHGVPYATVIVPWPVETIDEMLEDFSSTVAYAAKNETHLIEVNLPGYSKYFSSTNLFSLDSVWKAIVSRTRELREICNCPIIAMPTLYEENLYQGRKNLAEIIGVVKNSPAYLGGLTKGDLVLKINNFSIRNRPQARDILYMLNQSQINEITIAVQRNSQTREISLDLTNYSYPYSGEIDAHMGIIFRGTGLRMSYIEDLKQIIQAHKAKRVLFLSSALVKPTLEQCLSESHLFGNSQIKIDIEVPQNRFFGGNIFMGDLLVVQDFIDCINECIMKKGEKPDLVVIPSSPFNLNGWGRDLTGRVYLDIERKTGVPVELLSCSTIYD